MLRLGQTRRSAPTGFEVLEFWDNVNFESPYPKRVFEKSKSVSDYT
jgi:hypothetical protein